MRRNERNKLGLQISVHVLIEKFETKIGSVPYLSTANFLLTSVSRLNDLSLHQL